MWAWIVAGCVSVVAIAYWALRQRKKRKEEEDMAFGLKVWDENQIVVLDNVDNVGRLFATVSFPAWSGTSKRTVSVPGLDPDRVAYALSAPTHTHLAIQLVPGAVEAWLTRSDSTVGTTQPAFSLFLISTR